MFTKLLLTLLTPSLLLSNFGVVKGVSTKTPGWHKLNEYAVEPIIKSPSATIMDPESGQIFYKKNYKKLRPVASITKLITAYSYLKYTNYDLERKIKLLKIDERNGGKRNIYRGEVGTAEDFLNMALIASDNSAAAALARSAGIISNFKEVSNKALEELHIYDTQFVEPTGLNPDNKSTAYDIAKIAKAVFADSVISKITNKDKYTFSPLYSNKKRTLFSTNKLFGTNLFEIKSGKTGYTKEAGFCLVLKVANKQGKEAIIVVLGAPTSEDRFQDAKSLAWWFFKNYE